MYDGWGINLYKIWLASHAANSLWEILYQVALTSNWPEVDLATVVITDNFNVVN